MLSLLLLLGTMPWHFWELETAATVALAVVDLPLELEVPPPCPLFLLVVNLLVGRRYKISQTLTILYPPPRRRPDIFQERDFFACWDEPIVLFTSSWSLCFFWGSFQTNCPHHSENVTTNRSSPIFFNGTRWAFSRSKSPCLLGK